MKGRTVRICHVTLFNSQETSGKVKNQKNLLWRIVRKQDFSECAFRLSKPIDLFIEINKHFTSFSYIINY